MSSLPSLTPLTASPNTPHRVRVVAGSPTRNDPADRRRRGPDSGDGGFERDLLDRLAALPFPAFAAHVAAVLARLGYGRVRPAGRPAAPESVSGKRTAGRGRNRGKNADGGIDLTADLIAEEGRSTGLVVVQLKQYRPGVTVQQRFVDELRGAAVRAGAREALLITTASFSALAEANARAGARAAGIAPVRLIPGIRLAADSAAAGCGVVRDPATGRWTVDEAYFAALAEERFRTAAPDRRVGAPGLPPRTPGVPQSATPAAPPAPPAFRSVRVTVTVSDDFRHGGEAGCHGSLI